MASEETMRLRIKATDEASKPLRKISEQMKAIKATPEMRAAREQMAKIKDEFRSFAGLASNVGGSLATIGGVSLTAAASFGAFMNAMRGAADRANGLRVLAQDTGMAASALNRLEAIGKRFDIPTSAIDSTVQNLASKMPQLKRGIGDLYGILREKDPAFAAQMRQDAQRGDTEALYGHSLGFLRKFKDEQERRHWAGEIFGNSDIARMFPGGGGEAFAQASRDAKGAGEISGDLLKAAKDYKDASDSLTDAFDKMKNELAPGPLRGMTAVLETVKQIAENTRHDFEGIMAVWERMQSRMSDVASDPKGGLMRKRTENVGKLSELDRAIDRTFADPDDPAAAGRRAGLMKQKDDLQREQQELTRKIEEGVAKGAEKGVKDGIDATLNKSSFEGGTSFGAMLQNASFVARQAVGGGGGSYGGGGGRFNGLPRMGGGGGGGGMPKNPMYSGGAPGGSAMPVGPGTGIGHLASKEERAAFIRAEAARRGIDPEIALRVAQSEGFNKFVGDQGTSFGDFQLHYKNNIRGLSNPGLGDAFTRATGLHASDPNTWREQTRFALDNARKSGWGAWHGWRGDPWAGIGIKPYEIGGGSGGGRNPLTRDAGWPNQWHNMGRYGGSSGRFQEDILGNAARAGLLGGVNIGGKIGAELTIKTAPGVEVNTKASTEGSYLKGVKINRGQTMPDPLGGD